MGKAIGKGAALVAGVVAGLTGLAAATSATLIRRPLPRIDGTLSAPGLRASVEIVRDRWGVPHIFAECNADLFFAQGYVHAQDRLWQMELQRRTALGELAEIFGVVALDSDRFLRVLGFGRVAREEASALGDPEREAVTAYCRGVNAFLAANPHRLPLEFAILRCRPRHWEPADVLAFSKVMALDLSTNWTSEIIRARIVATLGATRAALLDPAGANADPLTLPADADYTADFGASALRTAAAAEPFAGERDGTQGSNAWVVGGARTASGGPLLANDPHLALSVPSLWYENHLHGGDYAVTGASIPGTVGATIGHNARIAWGVTNGMNDIQDLYIERFDPTDPSGTRYEFRGAWEEATIVREEIAVRARPLRARTRVETVAVRITRHGPIVSDLLPPGAAPTPDEATLALRWTALEPGHLQRAMLALNRAGDWSEFRAALRDWTVPPQNFVYADVAGHIGYALGGAIPIRAQGDGRLPIPGWTGEWEWTGMIPPEENPHALDPAAGFVVTANNRIVGDSYPHPLPGEWAPGYRAARIRELITRGSRHNAASFGRIHADRLSAPGRALAALARAGRLPLLPDEPLAPIARDVLAIWDGNLIDDSVAGAIAATLLTALQERAYRAIAGPLSAAVGLGTFATLPGRGYLQRSLPRLLDALAGGDTSWLAPDDTPDAILRDAWGAALAALRAEQGEEIALWRYGTAHALTLRHPLGALGPLGRLFNRGPFPQGGDLNTVCMGSRTISPAGVEFYNGPSYRQICDPTDWDASRSVYPGGQSGHPGSPHYADLLSLWLNDAYHPLLWSRPAIDAATEATLTLTP